MPEIIVSTGVKFKTKDVPVMVYQALKNKLNKERPKVPTWYNDQKDREESNPSDPDYLEAVSRWEEELTEKLMDAAIVLGIEVAEIPEGMEKSDSEGWKRQLESIGIEVPVNGNGRYLAWVKYYAAPTIEDMRELISASSRNAGVTEEDAAQAAALFRHNEERGTD